MNNADIIEQIVRDDVILADALDTGRELFAVAVVLVADVDMLRMPDRDAGGFGDHGSG